MATSPSVDSTQMLTLWARTSYTTLSIRGDIGILSQMSSRTV